MLWPPQLLRLMVTAKTCHLIIKHPTLRPPSLFSASVPGSWTLPGLTTHWSHHMSMFLTTPHVLTSHLPSLNFMIIIFLTTLFRQNPFHLLCTSWPGLGSTLTPRKRNPQSHQLFHSEHMATNPKWTLNAGRQWNCGDMFQPLYHSSSENSAPFPPRISNTASPICTLSPRSDFAFSMRK